MLKSTPVKQGFRCICREYKTTTGQIIEGHVFLFSCLNVPPTCLTLHFKMSVDTALEPCLVLMAHGNECDSPSLPF